MSLHTKKIKKKTAHLTILPASCTITKTVSARCIFHFMCPVVDVPAKQKRRLQAAAAAVWQTTAVVNGQGEL